MTKLATKSDIQLIKKDIDLVRRDLTILANYFKIIF